MKLYLNGPRLPWGFRLGLGVDPMDYLRTLSVPGLQTPDAGRGSFLYVITDGLGNSKLGVSRNPLQRLRDLQAGHPERLELAWVAVTPGDGYNIEACAKLSTEHYSASGGTEWRRAPSSELVRAIGMAAVLLGEPIRSIPPESVAVAVEELSRWQPQSSPLAPPPLPVAVPAYYRHPVAFVAWMALLAVLVIGALIFVIELGKGGAPSPAFQSHLGDFPQQALDLIHFVDQRT